MTGLVVSSRNPHKLDELRTLLAPLGLPVRGAADLDLPDVEETGRTFLDNALLKAAAAFERTGGLCLADDSGLCVDALGGAPGVLSARFAGDDADYLDNNRRLVQELAAVPDAERGARFVCMLALLVPDARVVAARAQSPAPAAEVSRADVPAGAHLFAIEGRVEGRILHVGRGAAGFGYDPLFLHEPTGLTFAELAPAAKHVVSHRGRAFSGLLEVLRWATAPPRA